MAAQTQLAPMPPPTTAEALCSALLDSRQRWKDLVSMTADLAFEVDLRGCFTFVAPDVALGWQSSTLLGCESQMLLDTDAAINPFRLLAPARDLRTFLRRGDGSWASCSVAVAPLLDKNGALTGLRGVARDISSEDHTATEAAATLRRAALVDHILTSMHRAVMAPEMMKIVLDALLSALGADGAMVLEASRDVPPVLHHVGVSADLILREASALIMATENVPRTWTTEQGASMIAVNCRPRFGCQTGLVVWRNTSLRPWNNDDMATISSVVTLVRMTLEHETMQREMFRQAWTDPLTGLLNRRSFYEELDRRFSRLDRNLQPGTLLYIDLDNFKPINDKFGHDVGDEALCSIAALLRQTVRPTDLIARLGGDEFVIWMDNADHFVAAERAAALCHDIPRLVGELGDTPGIQITASIGIAERLPNSKEDTPHFLHRADQAMYAAKRSGPGRWFTAKNYTP